MVTWCDISTNQSSVLAHKNVKSGQCLPTTRNHYKQSNHKTWTRKKKHTQRERDKRTHIFFNLFMLIAIFGYSKNIHGFDMVLCDAMGWAGYWVERASTNIVWFQWWKNVSSLIWPDECMRIICTIYIQIDWQIFQKHITFSFAKWIERTFNVRTFRIKRLNSVSNELKWK